MALKVRSMSSGESAIKSVKLEGETDLHRDTTNMKNLHKIFLYPIHIFGNRILRVEDEITVLLLKEFYTVLIRITTNVCI